jgi:hypothetical protein
LFDTVLPLRRFDCGDDLIVFWPEQTERADVAIANYAVRVDHKNRARDFAGNQRFCSIGVGDAAVGVCE